LGRTGDDADDQEIGDQRSKDRRKGPVGRDPEPKARIEVVRLLAAGGRPKVGRLVDVGQGWSLIGIMMAVRLVTSPTCSLVVGPGAQARMCRRREDALRLLSASSTAARHERVSDRAVGPRPPSTRGQIPTPSTLLAA
jgi:hypothetical protein